MNECNYPTPPSHRTFNFGPITIDSNFDSGNCSEANKLSGNTVAIPLFSLSCGSAPIIPTTDTALGSISPSPACLAGLQ